MRAATLDLTGLEIRAGTRVLVRDVHLSLETGWVVALVGPSGSGKTLTARALLGLVDLDPGVVAGELSIQVGTQSIRPYRGSYPRDRRGRDRAFRNVRGSLIAYLPQDCRSALDPLLSVGRSVALAAQAATRYAADPLPWLRRVGFRDADGVARAWPHELSGGMAQRVVIAQALARGSRFLLADEPTAALDPTVQLEIIDVLRALSFSGVGLLVITHDLRLVPELANEVVVMDGGTVVERTTPEALVRGQVEAEPTQRLLDATRRIAGGRLG